MVATKSLIKRTVWNLLMAAAVYLPVYLLISVAELKLRGAALTEPFLYALSGAAVLYVSLLAPVLLGAIVHSMSILLIPSRITGRSRQGIVVALALMLPFTTILYGIDRWPGVAWIFQAFPISTAIATLAYGLCCAHRMGLGQQRE